MFRRLAIALFVAGLFCVPVSLGLAQESETATVAESSDWYYDKLIKSVSFKGLNSVDTKDVDGVVSSYVGKRFTDELFAEMLDRIYALEYFDDVSPDRKSVV